MVAVATHHHQRGSGYSSFPRTSPSRSFSHDTPPASSPWFSCNGNNADAADPPETSHPPSPPVSFNCMGDGALQETARKTFAQQDPRQFQRQATACYPVRQQQRQPSYPTTIQFRPSQDDCAPSDEEFMEPSWGLSRMSLGDTFGFDNNTLLDSKANTKGDELFESLYTGTLQEDNGTKESSSVELNPYSPKVTAKGLDVPVRASSMQRAQLNQKKNNLNRYQETSNSRPMQQQLRQQGRDSIFRPQTQSQSTQHHPAVQKAKSGPASYEKKVNANMHQLISPTAAMERRRSHSRPRARQEAAVVSPNSSFFTSASANSASIKRTGTGSSLRRNNTGSSNQSRSRHRSTSRSHRSRSRGTSRRRSRSRSTSVAPSSITHGTKASRKSDDYHSNLFRGAALIREQLLRSMASADEAMDEAEREFMEGMIERGSAHKERQGTSRVNASHQIDEDDEFEYDYSFGHRQRPGGTATACDAPTPSRSNAVRFAPSQDSSALDTESRRLDNLVSIFAANSSMSSSADIHNMSRSSSDKENQVGDDPRPGTLECRVDARAGDPNVISPMSSLGLTSPTAQQMMHPVQNTKVHNEYASRHFREDAPKPAVAKPPVETTPVPSKKASLSQHDIQIRHPADEADEALAHARRAGPLWRSLVGNHVRFPSKWDDVLPPASPPVDDLRHKWSKWYYVARHRVKGDRRLNSREYGVRSRRSGGRILMRMVVREMHSQRARREIAIGCFHPNSRGIRRGDPVPDLEDAREVWMAVRWVVDADEDEPAPDLRPEGCDYEGVVDNFLMQRGKRLDYGTMGSALGHRKAVNNENVKAIFGDQPPMTTVDLHEDEVAEIIKSNGSTRLAALPALALLKLFLFSK